MYLKEYSERDYARKIVLKNKASKDTFVHEIMARDVITVKPTDVLYGIDEYKRIRHLPP
jgi:signal-transduction protein with cAMP-binding, CBS, and nucleotidyltransferase domain